MARPPFLYYRMLERGKYRIVHRVKMGMFPLSESPTVAKMLYDSALKDIREHPNGYRSDGIPIFKLTIKDKKGLMERSKHFNFGAPGSAQNLSCKDCKDTGWYVGMVERYPCPTCQKGKVNHDR